MAYRLPGTRFVQVNPKTDDGNCFGVAVGSALRDANVHFKSTARNLDVGVRNILKEQVLNEATLAAMNKAPGAWQKGVSVGKDAEEYSELHLDAKKWGTTFELHLVALYFSNHNRRFVVHTKHSNTYRAYLPLNIDEGSTAPVCPVSELDPSNINKDDLVLCNNGNSHWSYAEFKGNLDIAPLFEEQEVPHQEEGVIDLVSSDDEM
jgi:hypothetical protein